MALKAKSTVVQEQEEVKTTSRALAPAQRNLPATQGASAVELNAGVLEGIDGIDGGNRVTMDGSEFLVKSTGEARKELLLVVSQGRRLYQYWDDASNLCQSYDGKVSEDGTVCATCEHKRAKNCKFKFEIRWVEQESEDVEPVELIFTLPTVSAVNFVDYVKNLAKEGLGVNQVITRVTIERRSQPNSNNRYSVAIFEKADILA